MSALPEPLDSWEGRRVDEWARLWDVPHVEAYGQLPSTNERLRALAEQGAGPFTVVLADSQSAGKGRGGKRWESPAGMGLWFSFLVPGESLVSLTLVPILVGLATTRALERICPSLDPGIKWPNDIEVEGRKLGGILCESTGTEAAVVGVGLNLRQGIGDFAPGLKERAASLEMAGCRGVSRSMVATELLSEVRSLADPPPSFLDQRLRQAVNDRDILKGRTVRTDSGVVGKAIGLAADGALLIEVEGRVQALRAGGVTAVI